jgi:hypothetical protein
MAAIQRQGAVPLVVPLAPPVLPLTTLAELVGAADGPTGGGLDAAGFDGSGGGLDDAPTGGALLRLPWWPAPDELCPVVGAVLIGVVTGGAGGSVGAEDGGLEDGGGLEAADETAANDAVTGFDGAPASRFDEHDIPQRSARTRNLSVVPAAF